MDRYIHHRIALAVTLGLMAPAASVAGAQTTHAEQGPVKRASAAEQRSYPAPTNLKVLPRSLTGRQVHDIMEKWSSALGVECTSCHAEDQNHVGPRGETRMMYADDSKQMKDAARKMYTMTDAINSGYIANVEGSDMPVTCGTCHRGRVSPEPYDAHPQTPSPAIRAYVKALEKTQQP